MARGKYSGPIVIAGIALAALLWLLDSVVDYAVSAHDLTFFEMVVTPPLHAAFARMMLAITVMAFAWAISRVVLLLEQHRARIEHLNSVLQSISAINQLIVRKQDARRLVEDACQALTTNGQYRSAWIMTVDGDGRPERVVSQGVSDDFDDFEADPRPETCPPCVEEALDTEEPVEVRCGDDDCPGCGGENPDRRAVAVALRYAERLRGCLVVVLPDGATASDEDRDLLMEIAGDLAMGLHSIEADEELERHSALLVEAERLASLGAWRWDVEAGHFHFSEEWRRIHGVEDETMTPEKLIEVAHPEDRERIEEAWRASLEDGVDYDIEHRIIRQSDGVMRWVDAHGESVRDEDGAVKALLGAAQDITERKQAEQSLRESREELAAIYASAPVTMMLVDPDRRVRKVNGYGARRVGRTEEEAVGLRGGEVMRCLHHLDDPRGCGFSEACQSCAVRKTVLETFETGEPRYQVEATLPVELEGEVCEVTFLVSTTLLGHKQEPLVLVTIEDITERKRVEREMRALSRFREAVIEQANVMVVVFSPEGRVLVWNRAAAEITGYSADEVMGREAWDQLLEDEEEIAGVREMLDSMVREGADFTDVETRIRTADGERRLVSWHARRLADDQGNAMGAVAMGRDVTEQRELERKVERSARMEAIGRLAGGVAHDFNNMLTAIIGNAKLLEPELEDEHLRGQLTDIRDAGERSAALTRQLLTFSRQVPTEAMVFELNDVVEGMQSMLERLTKEHTRIEVDLAHEPTTVRADPAQMEQVLMNLAVNAETAMPDGGRLTIETSVEDVDGETMPEIGGAEYVVLRVSDTGCGMDEETLERAFEPFFTTRQEGTGLGLATVYGIVQESGGEIELQSTPGEGTTATVYLPRVDEAPEEIDPAPTAEGKSAEADAATQARVLLAEDEKQVRTLIAGILRSEGYEVLTAESGEAAREMYDQQEQPLDLVVTDVVMTGLSGTDLAEHIRADAPQLPVLFISGYSDLQLPQGARLLQKPFLPEDLMDAVRDVLDSSGD